MSNASDPGTPPPATIGVNPPDLTEKLTAASTQIGQMKEQLKQAQAAAAAAEAAKSAALAEAEKAAAKNKELQTTLASVTAGITPAGDGKAVDVEAIIRTTREVTAAEVKASVQNDIQALTARVESAERERARLVAETLRTQAVSKASQESGVSPELLEALVPSGTPADVVEAKVKASVDLLKRALPPGSGGAGRSLPQGHEGASLPAGPNPNPSAPNSGSAPGSLEELAKKSRTMTDAEWKAQRVTLLQRAAGRYGVNNPAGA